MKKRGLSWQYMRGLLPDVDHPEFNALRNGRGSKVNIPVTLYKDDEPVLSAEIRMFSSAAALYKPALWLLLKDCEDHGIDLDWDKAGFVSEFSRFPKDEITDWSADPMTSWMQSHNTKSFRDMLELVTEELAELPKENDPMQLRQKFNSLASHMAASFQLQGVEIVSKDLDQMKSDRKWTGRAVKGMKALLGLK